jgi:SAM-dependent methyltransferase
VDAAMIEPERMRRLLADRDPSAPEQLRSSLAALPKRHRDDWLDSVLEVDSFAPDSDELPRGCAPYLPCSVDVILQAVDGAGITSRDVFVDIGSGIGRAAALTHLLTGAGAIGIEIQPGLVRQSLNLAKKLMTSRFATVEGDAAELVKFIPIGTVFFLYCPFSGARLERVLDALAEIATTRSIRLCCVQVPTLRRSWLERVSPEDGELVIYRSRFAPRM